MLENLAQDVRLSNLVFKVAQLPAQVWDAMKEASVKVLKRNLILSNFNIPLSSSYQTWMTYSWSLSWANVDKAFLVEQETKAGFWNQDIQVSRRTQHP